MLGIDIEEYPNTLIKSLNIHLCGPYSLLIDIHNSRYGYFAERKLIKYTIDKPDSIIDGHAIVPLKYRLEITFHLAIDIPKDHADYDLYYENKWLITLWDLNDADPLKPYKITDLTRKEWLIWLQKFAYVDKRYLKELSTTSMMNRIMRTVVKYNKLIRTGKI